MGILLKCASSHNSMRPPIQIPKWQRPRQALHQLIKRREMRLEDVHFSRK